MTVRTELLLAGWGFGAAAEEAGLAARFAALGVTGGFGDDLLRLGGVKPMPDGGMVDRTARLREPYLNEPANRGTWVFPPERPPGLIRRVHDLGWAIDGHPCGDETQEVIVRTYADAQTAAPKPCLRHRVHHAYFPTATTLRLMAAHPIPALGLERAARAMPMRGYLDAGVPPRAPHLRRGAPCLHARLGIRHRPRGAPRFARARQACRPRRPRPRPAGRGRS